MTMLEQLKERARRDFADTGLEEFEWQTFWAGYLAAVKRFGGKR